MCLSTAFLWPLCDLAVWRHWLLSGPVNWLFFTRYKTLAPSHACDLRLWQKLFPHFPGQWLTQTTVEEDVCADMNDTFKRKFLTGQRTFLNCMLYMAHGHFTLNQAKQ